MRSTFAILSVSSVLSLVAATGMPHMIENGVVYAREEQSSTSTSTEIAYVTITRTIPTDGYGAPYTSVITPTLPTVEPTPTPEPEPEPTPYPEVPAQNTTIPTSYTQTWTYSTVSSGTAIPTYGGNQTHTSVTPPSPSATNIPDESDSSAGTFGVSKVMGMMGVVAVIAGML